MEKKLRKLSKEEFCARMAAMRDMKQEQKRYGKPNRLTEFLEYKYAVIMKAKRRAHRQ